MFIFIECIHFIVFCIDNIHPQKRKKRFYSRLIGKRSWENVNKISVHYFKNPKTEEELTEIIGGEKDKDKEKMNRRKKLIKENEINPHKDNETQSKEDKENKSKK